MQVELTEEPTSFRTLDWSHVVAADPSGPFFHTPAYLKLWWEEFGTGSLVLARGSDGNQIVAACAFEVVGGSLRFLGGLPRGRRRAGGWSDRIRLQGHLLALQLGLRSEPALGAPGHGPDGGADRAIYPARTSDLRPAEG